MSDSSNWGPGYGHPSHPTTGELPRVGNGVRTDELRTVQVDTVGETPPPEPPTRHRYSWESEPEAPQRYSEPRSLGWSVPRVGRPDTAPPRSDDTAQFARVGDGLRGAVGPVSVQVEHVRADGINGDTQLLSTAAFRRPDPVEAIPDAVESPEPGTGSMPATRRQMGPDWTQMPLRLLGAAVVATAVLGASAASLISIGNWINP